MTTPVVRRLNTRNVTIVLLTANRFYLVAPMKDFICFYWWILLSAAHKNQDTARDFTLEHLESRFSFAVDFISTVRCS